MRKFKNFIAALLVLAMIGTVFITDVRAETEWTPSGLEESYDIGTSLVIPVRDVTVACIWSRWENTPLPTQLLQMTKYT